MYNDDNNKTSKNTFNKTFVMLVFHTQYTGSAGLEGHGMLMLTLDVLTLAFSTGHKGAQNDNDNMIIKR